MQSTISTTVPIEYVLTVPFESRKLALKSCGFIGFMHSMYYSSKVGIPPIKIFKSSGLENSIHWVTFEFDYDDCV